MGLFHHESDEAQAHEQVRYVPSISISMEADRCYRSKGQEQWTQGPIVARAHCCCCVLRGILHYFIHDIIASNPLFQAAKAYEKHCENNGKPASHAEAKKILWVFPRKDLVTFFPQIWNRAALSGAFIDHIVETKGVSILSLIHFSESYQDTFFSSTSLTNRRQSTTVRNVIKSLELHCVLYIFLLAEKQLGDVTADHYWRLSASDLTIDCTI